MLDEILAVVERKGIKLTEPDMRKKIKAHCRVRYNKPSMMQHVERGQRTEIDALNGALVREARALGDELWVGYANRFGVLGEKGPKPARWVTLLFVRLNEP